MDKSKEELLLEEIQCFTASAYKRLAELHEANERVRDILEHQLVLSGVITCH